MLHHRQRRRYQGEEPGTAFSSTSIFITPMLDMSFQILAFFVFTYHPAPPEGHFPIVLAAGEAGGEQVPKNPEQMAAPGDPALRPLVTVLAKADGRGDLGQLEVLFAGKRDRISFEGREQVDPDKLLQALQARLLEIRRQLPKDEGDGRSLSLLLQASDGLQWEQSVRVMDACRRARDEAGQEVSLFPKLELDFLR